MRVELSSEQEAVVRQITHWYEESDDDEIRVGGLAGTGKTTIARVLPEYLSLDPQEVAYCAYTGKAASVLNRRLSGSEATTIHRLIYLPREVHCEECPRGQSGSKRCHAGCEDCFVSYAARPDLDSDLKLVIVDESSMVSASIYDDLIAYGIPIVWLGDHGQLPPVKSRFNLMEDPDVRLETIHRQVADSPILKLAMLARETGHVPYGEFGPGVSKRPQDGTFSVGDELEDLPLLLCGRRRTRVLINRGVREQFGFHERRPAVGERVMCLRNNYEAGIYNGLLGRVSEIAAGRDIAGVETYRASVELEDGSVYDGNVAREQFGDIDTLHHLPREVDLFDYAYCLTVHKAQGSEADRVILLEEPLNQAMHARWLYTGITRAKRELEIIA